MEEKVFKKMSVVTNVLRSGVDGNEVMGRHTSLLSSARKLVKT